jgi:hypothetical protein
MPDFLLRLGIRLMLRTMLANLEGGSHQANVAAKMAYVKGARVGAAVRVGGVAGAVRGAYGTGRE